MAATGAYRWFAVFKGTALTGGGNNQRIINTLDTPVANEAWRRTLAWIEVRYEPTEFGFTWPLGMAPLICAGALFQFPEDTGVPGDFNPNLDDNSIDWLFYEQLLWHPVVDTVSDFPYEIGHFANGLVDLKGEREVQDGFFSLYVVIVGTPAALGGVNERLDYSVSFTSRYLMQGS